MDLSFDPVKLAIYIFVLAYSCIIHECAHVWVAWRLGDPTGKSLGRLTLDPRPHIDPFWTILLPSLTYMFSRTAIGGPKPAPVDPTHFKNPRSGQVLTALAGPASNLLLALSGVLLLRLLFSINPDLAGSKDVSPVTLRDHWEVTYYALFLSHVMFTNVMLAAFNLIPVPPLDGSRFLQFLLGRPGDALFNRLERMGMLPMMLAAYFLAPYAIRPFASLLVVVLARLFPPEYAGALVRAYFS